MKGLLVAIPLLLLPLASGQTTELSSLRKRCAEQERQIRDLETENARLRSMLERDTDDKFIRPTGGKVLDPSEAALPITTTTPPTPGLGGSYTVKAGDSLAKIARKYGTTPDALAKLNKLRNANLIRPGQTLRVPASAPAPPTPAPKAVPVPAPTPADPSANAGKTHTVKKGETYFRIAKIHGTTVAALTKANPGINPARLQIGQKIKLSPATTAVAPKPTPAPTPAPSPAPTPAPTPAAEPKPAPKPAVEPKPEPEPMPEPPPAEPTVRLIRITSPITFGDFAAKYKTTVSKLNELNGQNLTAATLLAKDSELYVPVTP